MIGRLIAGARRGARSDVARTGGVVFIALIAAAALTYGFFVIVGHTLRVADYGTVTSLISVVMLATTPAAIGQTIVAKAVAARSGITRGIPRSIASRTITVSLASGGIIVAAALVWQAPIAVYLRLERPEQVLITAVTTALAVVLYLNRGLLQGAGRFNAFAMSNILDGLLRFVLGWFLTRRFGVDGALLAVCCAVAVATTYGVAAGIRATAASAAAPSRAVPRERRAMVATGLISLALIALGFYDPILVKHYLTPVDTGTYGVVSLAGRTVAIALSFVPIVLLPNVIERTVRGSSTRTMLSAAFAATGTLGAAATLLCALAAPLVVRLLAGPSFIAAAPLLSMYVGAAAFLAVANTVAAYLIGKHDYRCTAPLVLAAAGEVVAVVMRHTSPYAIVEDVLAGHAAVAAVCVAAVLLRMLRTRRAGPRGAA